MDSRSEVLANPEPMVDLVDTHCHPYLSEVEPSVTLEKAREGGVRSFVVVGVDPRSSRSAVDIAIAHPDVVATAGMHPHDASGLDPQARADIRALAVEPSVVALGETGLDFFRMLSSRQAQEDAFRWHLRLSGELSLPVVVHVRDAWERAIEILDEEEPASVVLHCFSADAETARVCASRGWFLSFAGPITYPKNEHLREAVAAVPMSQVLTETDSPYLAPQPLRGRENSPGNVGFVVEVIASARSESRESVATAVMDNARRAFPGLR